MVNASATIRALNRALGWQLPTDRPAARSTACCSKSSRPSRSPAPRCKHRRLRFEVLQIADNAIRTVRVRQVRRPKRRLGERRGSRAAATPRDAE